MKRNISTRSSLLRSSAALAILVHVASGTAAHAAEEAADTERDDETIVVTANKRAERLQDVAASISALTEESLKDRSVYNLSDISRTVPGVNLSSQEPGRGTVSIRGITTSSFAPTVGFYVDDVPIATALDGVSGQSEPQLFDTQRIEVLKGPQGTLYGGSSLGGAIKFISNRPDAGDFSGNASGQVETTKGGDESYLASGVVNVPVVTDKAAIRLGAYYRDVGGYIDRIPGGFAAGPTVPGGGRVSRNTTSIEDINSYTVKAGRAAVGLTPADGFSIVGSLYAQDAEQRAPGLFWPLLPGLTQSNLVSQRSNDEFILPTLTVTKDFGALELTSITGYYDRKHNQQQDLTFFVATLAPPLANFNSPSPIRTNTESFTQELRLSYAGERAKVVVGGFYQKDDTTSDQILFTLGTGVTSSLPADQTFLGHKDFITTQLAGFGDINYALTPKLELTLGGRVFALDQKFNVAANGLFNGGPTSSSAQGSDIGFVPKIGLTYRMTDDNLVYALANEGFRPGSGNAPIPQALCGTDLAALGLTSAPITYKSDTLWNYEVGTKNSFADGKLIANVSAFYIDWKDIQQRVQLPSCGFNFIGNVGSATSKGVELDFRVKPLSGLSLAVNAVYTDAEIKSSLPGVQARPGDRVLFTPDWTLNVLGEYTFEAFGDKQVTFAADYQYRGDQSNTFNRTINARADPLTGVVFPARTIVPNPAFAQDGYDSLNLHVRVEWGNLAVRLFANNVLNDRPLINFTADQSFETNALTLRPRTFGIRADVRF